ncbi:hypothetical protein J3R83DRAFT_5404 [Lanmaoa asiatica]|nr:hypothetical protein J3R83DRAFT_5404 [Lanmaoa asiatica]
MDEAHSARKHNLAHMAARALRERATLMVAMTATPVTTKPQDLWIMGQLLGIQSFFDYQEFQTLNRDVNRATRHDNQSLREAGEEGSVLRGALTGSHNPDTPELEFRNVMLECMKKMRERFAPYVIRRTIDSLDSNGDKIFGMWPKSFIPVVTTVRVFYLKAWMQHDIAASRVLQTHTAKVKKNKYSGQRN